MVLRPGKLLLIALIPVALYGAAKGLMYYKAKSAMDDIVVAASNVANIRYDGIATEVLGGAVTVEGITVEPRGYTQGVQVDAVRLASDDPLVFTSAAAKKVLILVVKPARRSKPRQMEKLSTQGVDLAVTVGLLS